MSQRISQLQSMLDRDPADTFCLYALAMEHAKLGQTSEAVQWFDRTIAADPASCYAYYHKAKALEQAGDRPAALAAIDAGLAAARQHGDMHAHAELEAYRDELA